MGKYDDFNLDLNKVKVREGVSSDSTGWSCVISTMQTLASACFTFDGSNTCNCPSTDCSPSDMTACRDAEMAGIMRC